MGKVKEGSATFWRESRFKLASCKDVLLRDVFKQLASSKDALLRNVFEQLASSKDALLRNVFEQPLDASHAHWNVMLDASKELTKALQKVTTVAQVTVLEPTSTSSSQETPIVVMNTHLFFHPYAPHIRNMHTAAILEEAWALIQGLALEKEPAIMFVGDLNSDLNDGVVELLQSGKLAPDFWDWDMGAAFKWGMDEEEGTEEQQASAPKPPGSKLGQAAAEVAAADSSGSGAEEVLDAATSTLPTESSTTNSTPLSVPKHNVPVVGIEVQMPFGALRSADDLATPYTNYTSGYKALLDYVLKSVPVPSVETLGGFIPNSLFPSDHLGVRNYWGPGSTAGRRKRRISGVLTGATAIDVESPTDTSAELDSESLTLKFVVPEFVTSLSQHLAIVGNLPELGGWDADKAAPLTWQLGHRWEAEVKLDASWHGVIEYKVILIESKGNKWEPGENRVTLVAPLEPHAFDEGTDATAVARPPITIVCPWGREGTDKEEVVEPPGVLTRCQVVVPLYIPPRKGTKQQLVLVGGTTELGNWDATKAVKLQDNGDHMWRGVVMLPAGKAVEAKVVLLEQSGGSHWEPGNNRSISIPASKGCTSHANDGSISIPASKGCTSPANDGDSSISISASNEEDAPHDDFVLICHWGLTTCSQVVHRPQDVLELPSEITNEEVHSMCHFVVPHFITYPGQHLLLVGSLPQLGSWNPNKGLMMTWQPGHMWVGEVELPVWSAQMVEAEEQDEVAAKVVFYDNGKYVFESGPDRHFKLSDLLKSRTVDLLPYAASSAAAALPPLPVEVLGETPSSGGSGQAPLGGPGQEGVHTGQRTQVHDGIITCYWGSTTSTPLVAVPRPVPPLPGVEGEIINVETEVVEDKGVYTTVESGNEELTNLLIFMLGSTMLPTEAPPSPPTAPTASAAPRSSKTWWVMGQPVDGAKKGKKTHGKTMGMKKERKDTMLAPVLAPAVPSTASLVAVMETVAAAAVAEYASLLDAELVRREEESRRREAAAVGVAMASATAAAVGTVGTAATTKAAVAVSAVPMVAAAGVAGLFGGLAVSRNGSKTSSSQGGEELAAELAVLSGRNEKLAAELEEVRKKYNAAAANVVRLAEASQNPMAHMLSKFVPSRQQHKQEQEMEALNKSVEELIEQGTSLENELATRQQEYEEELMTARTTRHPSPMHVSSLEGELAMSQLEYEEKADELLMMKKDVEALEHELSLSQEQFAEEIKELKLLSSEEKEAHASATSALAEELEEQREKSTRQLAAARSEAGARLSQLGKAMGLLEEGFEQRYNLAVQEHASQMSRLANRLEAERASLAEGHASQIAKLEADLVRGTAVAKEELVAALTESKQAQEALEATHAQQLTKLEQELSKSAERQLASLHDELAEKTRLLESSYTEKEKYLDAKVQNSERELQAVLVSLKAAHTRLLTQLEADFEAQKADLNSQIQEIEDVKGEAVAREIHLYGELSAKDSELQQAAVRQEEADARLAKMKSELEHSDETYTAMVARLSSDFEATIAENESHLQEATERHAQDLCASQQRHAAELAEVRISADAGLAMAMESVEEERKAAVRMIEEELRSQVEAAQLAADARLAEADERVRVAEKSQDDMASALAALLVQGKEEMDAVIKRTLKKADAQLEARLAELEASKEEALAALRGELTAQQVEAAAAVRQAQEEATQFQVELVQAKEAYQADLARQQQLLGIAHEEATAKASLASASLANVQKRLAELESVGSHIDTVLAIAGPGDPNSGAGWGVEGGEKLARTMEEEDTIVAVSDIEEYLALEEDGEVQMNWIESSVETAMANMARLEDALQSSQTHVRQLEEAGMQLAEVVAAAHADRDMVMDELKLLEDELALATTDRDQLVELLEAASLELSAVAKNSAADKDVLAKKLDQLTAELADKEEATAKLAGDKDILAKKLEQLTAELIGAMLDKEEATAQLAADKEEAARQMEVGNGELAAALAEKEEATAKLDTAKEEAVRQMEVRSAELAVALEEKEEATAKLAADKKEAVREIEVQTAELAAALAEKEEAAKKLAASKDEAAQEIAQLIAALYDNKEAAKKLVPEAELAFATSDRDKLAELLEAASLELSAVSKNSAAEKNVLAKKLEQLTAELAATLSDKEEATAKLAADKEEAVREMERLTAELTATLSDKEEATAMLAADKEKAVREMERLTAELTATLSDKEEATAKLAADKEEAEREMEQLTAELAATLADKEEAARKLAASKDVAAQEIAQLLAALYDKEEAAKKLVAGLSVKDAAAGQLVAALSYKEEAYEKLAASKDEAARDVAQLLAALYDKEEAAKKLVAGLSLKDAAAEQLVAASSTEEEAAGKLAASKDEAAREVAQLLAALYDKGEAAKKLGAGLSLTDAAAKQLVAALSYKEEAYEKLAASKDEAAREVAQLLAALYDKGEAAKKLGAGFSLKDPAAEQLGAASSTDEVAAGKMAASKDEAFQEIERLAAALSEKEEAALKLAADRDEAVKGMEHLTAELAVAMAEKKAAAKKLAAQQKEAAKKLAAEQEETTKEMERLVAEVTAMLAAPPKTAEAVTQLGAVKKLWSSLMGFGASQQPLVGRERAVEARSHLHDAISSARSERETLVQDLQAAVANTANLNRAYVELQQAMQEAKTETTAAREEAESAKLALAEAVASHEASLAEVRAQLESSKAATEAVQAELVALQAGVHVQSGEATASLAAVQAERDSVQQQLELFVMAKQEYDGRMKEMESTGVKLQQEVATLMTNRDTLQEMLSASETSVSATTDELAAATNELSDVRSVTTELIGTIAAAEHRISILEAAEANNRQSVAELEAQRDTYASRASELEVAEADSKQSLVQLQGQRDTLAFRASELEELLEASANRAADLEAVVSQLDGQNVEYMSKLSSSNLAAYEQRVHELESTVSELEQQEGDRLADVEAREAAMKKKETSLRNQLEGQAMRTGANVQAGSEGVAASAMLQLQAKFLDQKDRFEARTLQIQKGHDAELIRLRRTLNMRLSKQQQLLLNAKEGDVRRLKEKHDAAMAELQATTTSQLADRDALIANLRTKVARLEAELRRMSSLSYGAYVDDVSKGTTTLRLASVPKPSREAVVPPGPPSSLSPVEQLANNVVPMAEAGKKVVDTKQPTESGSGGGVGVFFGWLTGRDRLTDKGQQQSKEERVAMRGQGAAPTPSSSIEASAQQDATDMVATPSTSASELRKQTLRSERWKARDLARQQQQGTGGGPGQGGPGGARTPRVRNNIQPVGSLFVSRRGVAARKEGKAQELQVQGKRSITPSAAAIITWLEVVGSQQLAGSDKKE
eukprot:gene31102-6232_t